MNHEEQSSREQNLEAHHPSQNPSTTGFRKTAKLICLEEHAVSPFKVPTTSSTHTIFQPEYINGVRERLSDIEHRLKVMDANNIGAQIISMNQPTAQAFTALHEQLEWCRKSNNFVYEYYCKAHPRRFFAFASLPTHSGEESAKELARCVTQYGFVGAIINGFTDTPSPNLPFYLDNPMYEPLWEVAASLAKPIFIHPRVPLSSNMQVLHDIPILHGAPYGFARETAEHVMRLMYTGLFERHPTLKILLGHMGESLSFTLPRTDSTFRLYTPSAQGPKKHDFMHYFQNNILVNTSGTPRTSCLMQVLAETRSENVMFAVDYPYESVKEMRGWFEGVGVGEEVWRDIGWRNAERWFGLQGRWEGN
jgi:gamma-resorcylate decarboxylase